MSQISRLVIVTETWPTETNPISGVYVAEQVAAFADRALDVVVLLIEARARSSQPLSMDQLKLRHRGTVTIQRLPVFRVPSKRFQYGAVRWNAWTTRWVLRRRLANLLKTDAALLLHGGRYVLANAAILSGQVPTWLVMHGEDPMLKQAGLGPAWLRKRLIMAADACDAPVLVGVSLTDFINALGGRAERWHVVPNGTVLPDVGEECAPTGSGTVKLLSVSNLEMNKGIDVQLRALARLKDLRPDLNWMYRIVGDGPGRCELETLADDLGLEGQVVFVGRAPREVTLAEFASCDVFSLPSWREAFGIVYLEAMARGKPVIACKGVGPVGLVEHGVNGLLVPTKSVNALVSALSILVGEDAVRRRFGEHARETAKHYSWHANVERMLKLLPKRNL